MHIHYFNTPMQYTPTFTAVKNDNFQLSSLFGIFLIFAQIMDCGYTLELPH